MGRGTILSATAWTSNAAMIRDVVSLGYLRKSDVVLDPTYGRGKWWTQWRPDVLVGSDLICSQDKRAIANVDFRQLPWAGANFDAAVFDPPYVCTGGRDTTGIADFFDRYGLSEAPRTSALLQEMNNAGLKEIGRVVKPRGFVLVKTADYVSCGKLFLGSHHTLTFALSHGFECWDRLIYVGHARPQPQRTRKDGRPVVQQHARTNWSTLLVLKAPA